MKEKLKSATVDAYIEAADRNLQPLLKQLRKIIVTLAPEAEESLSYGMPAYKYHGRPLVYFAAYENHIGFYATPSGHEAFKKYLSVYKTGKGSVQFPINEKLPVKLIEKIVRFRVKENETHNISKKTKKGTPSNKKSVTKSIRKK